MSEYFSPRHPKSYTVKADEQVLIATRPSSMMCSAMYITNNSDVPVYLGFTGINDTEGNAKVNHGITIFPKSTVEFSDPIIAGCSVWATCESGTAILGVQE